MAPSKCAECERPIVGGTVHRRAGLPHRRTGSSSAVTASTNWRNKDASTPRAEAGPAPITSSGRTSASGMNISMACVCGATAIARSKPDTWRFGHAHRLCGTRRTRSPSSEGTCARATGAAQPSHRRARSPSSTSTPPEEANMNWAPRRRGGTTRRVRRDVPLRRAVRIRRGGRGARRGTE